MFVMGDVSDFVFFPFLSHRPFSAALETEASGLVFTCSRKGTDCFCFSCERLNLSQKFLKYRTKIITLFYPEESNRNLADITEDG